MRRSLPGVGTITALAMTLAACGGTNEPANNMTAEDVNALMNVDAQSPAAPSANVAVEEAVTEEPQAEPAAPKTAPVKPAPAKPKPPAPAPAPDPHAGHDMNNMQH